MAILMAAHQVFVEKGFYDATVQDIASRAKIGKGTLYEYFDTKEAMAESLMDLMLLEYEGRMQELSVDAITEVAQLEALITGFLEVPEHMQESMPFFLEVMGHSCRIHGSLIAGMERWFTTITVALLPVFEKFQREKKINPYRDLASLIRVLIGALDGIMLHTMIFPDEQKQLSARKKAVQELIRAALYFNT